MEKKDEIFLLMACHVIRKITKILWSLDTEYSNYMKVDKLIFSKLDESYQDFVKLDNEFKVFIIKKGKIIIIQIKKKYCLYHLRWFL